jgi:hypothetical protein
MTKSRTKRTKRIKIAGRIRRAVRRVRRRKVVAEPVAIETIIKRVKTLDLLYLEADRLFRQWQRTGRTRDRSRWQSAHWAYENLVHRYPSPS